MASCLTSTKVPETNVRSVRGCMLFHSECEWHNPIMDRDRWKLGTVHVEYPDE